VEPDQVDIAAFSVVRDLQQIYNAEEAGFARKHRGDIGQSDRLDGVDLDFAFFHGIAAAHLDVRARPDADAAGDISVTDALAQPLGEHHDGEFTPPGASRRLANSDGTPSGPQREPCFSWSTSIARRLNLVKKKTSASSRRAKQTSVSAESIFSKPPSKRQKAVLARVAKRQAAGDDSAIDYSDIPALTHEQLAKFRRAPKVLVAARLDREVVDWLKKYGEGYSTRINFILREAMARAQRT